MDYFPDKNDDDALRMCLQALLGDENPDYLDFAYFSFVIGMTCQVSDVQVASKTMRRLATVHGLISFAFNTAILAMFVNIVAGLI